MNYENHVSDLKRMRILLIILTLIQIGYVIIVLIDTKLWFKLDMNYKVNWLVFGFHFMVTGIFIWFNWNKLQIPRNKKMSNTFLFLFLGIIGMWLWIPNNQEMNKFTKEG